MAYLGSGPAPKATELDANSVETADIQNNAVTTDKIANGAVTQAKLDSNINLGLKVTGVDYPGDDTAADPAGGQTITITGSGFAPTPTVYIDTTLAPAVTFVSNTEITITTPAKAAGTYSVYVINPDGTVGIRVMGISYSGTPTWVTPAGSLGSVDAEAISIQLVATGDTPLVYSLTTGSTLPAGVTLSSSGLISGTLATEQTFSFSVDVTDPENQTTPRSFSVTVVLGEPDFKFVTLLLHGDGTSGAQNNTFLDSSTNNFTITRNGNSTQGTFTPFSKPDGRWANYFDGSGDYLTFTGNSSTNFSGADWCVETWLYVTKAPSTLVPIINSTTGTNNWGPYLGLNINSNYTISASINGTGYSSTQTITLNTWNHLALVRSSGVIKVYLNGVATSISVTADINNSIMSFWIGYIGPPAGVTEQIGGYLSNLRIVKGSAVYTSNFTPSTTPLTAITNTSLLTCQSNRFKDNSSNNFAITKHGDARVTTFSPFAATAAYDAAVVGGSGYFDASGDYLSVAGSSLFAFGTGDFTLEVWINPNAISTATFDRVCATSDYNGSGFDWALNTGASALFLAGSSYGFSVNTKAWNHLVYTRSGTTLRGFLNGRLASYNTGVSQNISSTSTLLIGAGYSGTTYNGYMTGLRIIKGSIPTEYQTSSTTTGTQIFTTPTAPPTTTSQGATANDVELLLNFTNGGIIDNAMGNVLETVGNAQIDTGTVKYGTGALEFDGSGDWLSVPYTPDFSFGSGNFTIEFWAYFNSVAFGQALVRQHLASSQYQFSFYTASNGTLNYYLSSNGTSWDIASAVSFGSITTGNWVHVAFVRNGNTFTPYLNGVAGTTTTSSASLFHSTAALTIGGGPSIDPFTGFIDDLRITNGKARYTSNFTPPTSAFADKGQA